MHFLPSTRLPEGRQLQPGICRQTILTHTLPIEIPIGRACRDLPTAQAAQQAPALPAAPNLAQSAPSFVSEKNLDKLKKNR